MKWLEGILVVYVLDPKNVKYTLMTEYKAIRHQHRFLKYNHAEVAATVAERLRSR